MSESLLENDSNANENSTVKNDFLKTLFLIEFVRILSNKQLMIDAISCTQPFIKEDGKRLNTQETKRFLDGKDIFNLEKNINLADIVSISSLKENFFCSKIDDEYTQRLLLGSAFFQACANLNHFFIPSESDSERMTIFQNSERGSFQKYTQQTGAMFNEISSNEDFTTIIDTAKTAIDKNDFINSRLHASSKKNIEMHSDNISWYLGLILKDEFTPDLKDRKTNFKNKLDVIINSGTVDFGEKLKLYQHIKDAESNPNNPLKELCKMRGPFSSGYGKSSTWQDSLKVIKESIVSDIQKNANLVTNSNKQEVKEVLQHHRRRGWHIRDHADSYNDNINIFENLERAIKKTAEASYCPKNEL